MLVYFFSFPFFLFFFPFFPLSHFSDPFPSNPLHTIPPVSSPLEETFSLDKRL